MCSIIQRPCYQRGSPCQDPAGKWTTRRLPDDRKEAQTAVVWSCLPFIRSGQNHLARHSERGKKTRQTEEEVGRQRQGMDRPGVCQLPEGSGEQENMEKTGRRIICGVPMPLTLKGLMMMRRTRNRCIVRSESLSICQTVSTSMGMEVWSIGMGIDACQDCL